MHTNPPVIFKCYIESYLSFFSIFCAWIWWKYLTFEAFTSAVYAEIGVKCAAALIKWSLFGLNDLVSIAAIMDYCFCFAFFCYLLEFSTAESCTSSLVWVKCFFMYQCWASKAKLINLGSRTNIFGISFWTMAELSLKLSTH